MQDVSSYISYGQIPSGGYFLIMIFFPQVHSQQIPHSHQHETFLSTVDAHSDQPTGMRSSAGQNTLKFL